MSVLVSDLVIYGSANMPDVDGTTTGGAVSFSKRLSFSDISPNGLMDYVSSSASDTATVITLSYFDSTGTLQTEAKTLNGPTVQNGTGTMERILKGVVTGTTAAGDVAAISHTAIDTGTAQSAAAATSAYPAKIRLASGHVASAGVTVGQILRITNNTPAGVQYQLRYIVGIGTAVDPTANADDVYVNKDWSTVPTSGTTYGVYEGLLFESGPNQVTEIRRPFYNVVANASGGATLYFYEKIFVVNNNTSTALTSANVAIFSESPTLGSGVLIDIAVCDALNDNKTASTRQTLPTNADTTSLTWTTGSPPQSQNAPSPGNLPNGAAPNTSGALGVWLRLTLPAGSAAYKGVAQIRATGGTI